MNKKIEISYAMLIFTEGMNTKHISDINEKYNITY